MLQNFGEGAGSGGTGTGIEEGLDGGERGATIGHPPIAEGEFLRVVNTGNEIFDAQRYAGEGRNETSVGVKLEKHLLIGRAPTG